MFAVWIQVLPLLTVFLQITLIQGDSEKRDHVECAAPKKSRDLVYGLLDEGRRAYYRCRPGLMSVGSTESVCLEGKWSKPPPLCVGRACPGQFYIKHGTVTARYGGAIVHYSCEPGYTLRGPTTLMCDGHRWNGTQPECLESTPTSSDPIRNKWDHNDLEKTRRTHEDWLDMSDYSCISGRDGLIPAPRIDNARPTTRWAMHKGRARLYTLYRCKWGYSHDGAARKMYCQNGRWLGSRPTCRIVEDKPQPRWYGDQPAPGSLSHGDWLELADYTCMGTVADRRTVPLPSIPNAEGSLRYVISGGTPHMYAEYQCSERYKLASKDMLYMYCQEKAWVGEQPECVPEKGGQNTGDATCGQHNGGCQHICLRRSGREQCKCHAGYELKANGRACRKVPYKGRSGANMAPPLALFH